MKKTTRLRKALMERRAVVVPGCHDALSARLVGDAGFEAVQISGFGVAGALLAKPDVGLVQMKDVLDTAWNIVQATEVPVMVDADTGGGNAVNAAWATERFIAMGAARVSIPVASIMVAYKALKGFFQALRASPTGTLSDHPDWVPSFGEFTDFIGMKQYRALEDAYLPDTTVEEKYRATAG